MCLIRRIEWLNELAVLIKTLGSQDFFLHFVANSDCINHSHWYSKHISCIRIHLLSGSIEIGIIWLPAREILSSKEERQSYSGTERGICQNSWQMVLSPWSAPRNHKVSGRDVFIHPPSCFRCLSFFVLCCISTSFGDSFFFTWEHIWWWSAFFYMICLLHESSRQTRVFSVSIPTPGRDSC